MLMDIVTHIQHLWLRFTGPSYVHWLEAEVARLRAENRALMNSILGVAGIPPVITRENELARQESSTTSATPTPTAGSASAHPVAPLRRRSWQQIHRTLEIQATQKKESNGTTSF